MSCYECNCVCILTFDSRHEAQKLIYYIPPTRCTICITSAWIILNQMPGISRQNPQSTCLWNGMSDHGIDALFIDKPCAQSYILALLLYGCIDPSCMQMYSALIAASAKPSTFERQRSPKYWSRCRSLQWRAQFRILLRTTITACIAWSTNSDTLMDFRSVLRSEEFVHIACISWHEHLIFCWKMDWTTSRFTSASLTERQLVQDHAFKRVSVIWLVFRALCKQTLQVSWVSPHCIPRCRNGKLI